MKKKVIKSVMTVTALGLALGGLAACSEKKPQSKEPELKRLEAVDVYSIGVSEDAIDGIKVSWGAVADADEYKILCEGIESTTDETSVDLSTWVDFEPPQDGLLDIQLTALSYGEYKDSKPTDYIYNLQGVKLESPKIISFSDGVVEWSETAHATAYRIKIDGSVVDGNYHSTRLDLKEHVGSRIEITALNDGSSYYSSSDTLALNVNAARTALTLPAVSEYSVSGSTISWKPVGGVKEYRVVDVNMTVVSTLSAADELKYDMTGKTIVAAVIPVSDNPIIRDAVPTFADIKYLEGEGTAQNPYKIRTTMNLRAIDYYEAVYAEKSKTSADAVPLNHYILDRDIDYNAVAALEADSNFFTLNNPFFGVFDGNFKKLSNIRVVYDGGYWAMFDFIAAGATVKNLKFVAPEITNGLQDENFPLGASVAVVADKNYGTISGVTLKDARLSAAGGEVCGICSHNYGTVEKCTVTGNSEFIELDTGLPNQACYEMAGIVLENYGTVSRNVVVSLDIRGNKATNVAEWEYDDYGNPVKPLKYGTPYNNTRTVGGIVACNRSGGVVSDNMFGSIDMIMMNDDYGQKTSTGDDGSIVYSKGFEYGGIVAYNAQGGEIVIGASGNIGTMTWSDTADVGKRISTERGGQAKHDKRGTVVGQNDGRVSAK